MDKGYCYKTGKVCYSKREAAEVIRFYKTGHNLRHRGKNIPKRCYFCEFCKMYHLTHFKN